jgi:hypothetical protein
MIDESQYSLISKSILLYKVQSNIYENINYAYLHLSSMIMLIISIIFNENVYFEHLSSMGPY